MLSPKFAWNDFFSGTPTTTLNSSQYSSKQTTSTSSVYVLNCLFDKCTISRGNGGALYCTSVTYLFIEFSSFLSCKTSSGQAGAIYSVSSNTLQSVLYAVCGDDCTSTSAGVFAYVLINDAASSNNYVNYTSIVRCVNHASGPHCTLYIEYGRICCPSVNISMNKCTYYSGLLYTPFLDSSSVTSSLSYSTFADNIASDNSCIWCNRGSAKYEIKCCNILRNTQVTSSYGTIFARGNLVIKDSCILDNTANHIFYQEYTSCTITLSNCTVDKTANNGYLTIQSTVTKSFIHGLQHITTQNCHAQYDSAGYLTAVPYVSHSTKKEFCHTFKNNCQAKISESFPLNRLFIFTFIYSNQYGDCWCDCNSFYI
jgi:hypothetical protein